MSDQEKEEKRLQVVNQLERIVAFAKKHPEERYLEGVPVEFAFNALDVLKWMQDEIDVLSCELYGPIQKPGEE